MKVEDLIGVGQNADEVNLSLPALVELAEQYMRAHRSELFPGQQVAPAILSAQWVPVEGGGFLRCQITFDLH